MQDLPMNNTEKEVKIAVSSLSKYVDILMERGGKWVESFREDVLYFKHPHIKMPYLSTLRLKTIFGINPRYLLTIKSPSLEHPFEFTEREEYQTQVEMLGFNIACTYSKTRVVWTYESYCRSICKGIKLVTVKVECDINDLICAGFSGDDTSVHEAAKMLMKRKLYKQAIAFLAEGITIK